MKKIDLRKIFITLSIFGILSSCSGTVITNDDLENGSVQTSGGNLDFIYDSIDSLFGKYVTADRGLVNYAGIWADPLLKEVRDSISTFSLASLETTGDTLAFWVNAYNIIVIYYLQEYGLNRQDLIGFPLFSRKVYVAGDSISLDQLEKGTTPSYIKKFNFPLTHFGLVCAAISCPPLNHKAYRGKTVYQQLDKETEEFFNNDEFNPIKAGDAKVSALMDWYRVDYEGFVRDTTSPTRLSAKQGSTVSDFIRGYLKDPDKLNFLNAGPLTFAVYNWEINKQ